MTGESFYERTGRRTVDIISGGFPCQPFSVAGKQRGKEDDRYLWPEMVRVIKELRPTWVVGENVAGIIKLALPDILSELEACGYRTRTFLIPACAVGARHRRYRAAIVGYSEHNGLSSTEIAGGTQKTGAREQKRKKEASESSGTGEPRNRHDVANTESKFERRLSVGEEPEKPGLVSGCENVGHTYGAGLQTERTKQQPTRASRTGKNIQYSDSAGRKKQYTAAESNEDGFTGWRCDEGNICDTTSERLSNGSSESVGGQGTQEQESERSMRRAVESILGGMAHGFSAGMDRDLDFLINHYWDDEPDIPRIATGIEHRVDRLKCLGNAVVPQQFYPIFKAIAEVENLYHGTK